MVNLLCFSKHRKTSSFFGALTVPPFNRYSPRSPRRISFMCCSRRLALGMKSKYGIMYKIHTLVLAQSDTQKPVQSKMKRLLRNDRGQKSERNFFFFLFFSYPMENCIFIYHLSNGKSLHGTDKAEKKSMKAKKRERTENKL